MTDLAASVDVVSAPWKNSPYYANAEKWTFVFWDDSHGYREYFNKLDLTRAVELACGHGRHSELVAPLARQLTVVDVLPENIQVCRERLARFPNVQFIQNNGYDFVAIENSGVTAVYCYDAMVHFSPDLVEAYLHDTARILEPGGRALFHHSNFGRVGASHYGGNPHARNLMTMDWFHELAAGSNLEVVASKPMKWGGIVDLDGLTVLQKAA